MPQDRREPVRVGRVVGIFGLEGWVKVESYTRHREDLLAYGRWQLRLKEGWVGVHVTESRVQGRGLVAHVRDCDDRDAAQTLVGADIGVDWQDLPPRAPGEFYWAELQGLKVVDREGVELGTVSHLIETGANDVLVVERVGMATEAVQGPLLIPYIRSAIEAVDLDAGLIRVDWEAD
ncbi:MAG: ribosome maturation factor RimM [Acidiferrobacteraceae bacterium]